MKKLLLFSYFLTIFITAEARDYDLNAIGHIHRVAYSYDGKYIASAELGGLIRVYDSVTLDIVNEFYGLFDVSEMEFSPDNLYIALCEINEAGSDEILIFEIKTGNIIFRLIPNYISEITSISYRFDGQRLVSGNSNGLITVWDTVNGVEIITFNAPREWIFTVSYSPDGNKIISASIENIRIWDANNGTELKILPEFEQDKLLIEAYASYSQDGTKILIGYWEIKVGGIIKIYDSDKYDILYSFNIGNGNINRNGMLMIAKVSFIFNSNYIIICYRDRNSSDYYEAIIIMDYTNSNIIDTFDFDIPIAISPDGRNICYSDNKKDIKILKIN